MRLFRMHCFIHVSEKINDLRFEPRREHGTVLRRAKDKTCCIWEEVSVSFESPMGKYWLQTKHCKTNGSPNRVTTATMPFVALWNWLTKSKEVGWFLRLSQVNWSNNCQPTFVKIGLQLLAANAMWFAYIHAASDFVATTRFLREGRGVLESLGDYVSGGIWTQTRKFDLSNLKSAHAIFE